MKRQIVKYLITIIMVIATIGCNNDSLEDIISFDYKIVIDGWIENGKFAKVLLTSNTPYFASVDSASIRKLVLTGAKVSLSDGVNSEILILRKNEDYFPPYIYEGNEIIGDTGKIYTVTAEYGGKTAWASTTIPQKVDPDTIYFKLEPKSDSLGTIHIEFTDPPEIKNYYRTLTKRESKDSRFLSSVIMGIDDKFFSGQEFFFSIKPGQASYITSLNDNFFKIGDTVSIKFCTIDKAHYEFWHSFQEEVLNSSNPFASSLSGIISNVEGDGLGIWGGYGVSFSTIIIK